MNNQNDILGEVQLAPNDEYHIYGKTSEELERRIQVLRSARCPVEHYESSDETPRVRSPHGGWITLEDLETIYPEDIQPKKVYLERKSGGFLLRGPIGEARTKKLLELLREVMDVGFEKTERLPVLIGPNGEEFVGFEDIMSTFFPSYTLDVLNS